MPKLLRNAAQCLDCLEVIESTRQHDFVQCGCYNDLLKTGIYIDGGLEYQRAGAWDFSKYKDMSEYDGPFEEIPLPEDAPTSSVKVLGIIEQCGDEYVLRRHTVINDDDYVMVRDDRDLNNPYCVYRYDQFKKMV